MTTLPISMPYVFANVTTTQRLAYLDADFATLTNAVNGIGNGSVALANVNITGGNVAASANSVPLSALQATGTLTAQHYLRGDGTWSGIASPAGGTVTSINVNGGSTGFTFTGGPVDVSGNITMSGSYTGNIGISQISNYGTVGNVLTSNGSAWVSQAISTGTVTSINATSSSGFSFSGGPITSSGTLTLNIPAPGSSGNVLTSDGTNWVSQAVTATIPNTLGAVGTYAFCLNVSLSIQPGGTIAGAYLAYTNTSNAANGSPSGTWRAMGYGEEDYSTLWIRIA